MKRNLLGILFLSLVLLIGNSADTFGQQRKLGRNKKPISKYRGFNMNYINNIRITGGIGLAAYYGDLCDNFFCYKFRPHVNAGAYWRYNPRFSFRADLYYLRMYGNDANGDNSVRNLHFRSNNFELAAAVVYDLIPWQKIHYKRSNYTPYVFAGVGLLYFNPQAELNGQWHALRPLQTEGVKYSPITVSTPFGGGVRLKLNPFMDITFELGYRKTFSDYLDDVSTTYVNNASLSGVAADLADRTHELGFIPNENPNDPLHWAEGHKRGNPDRKDGYFMFGAKFEYMLTTTKQIYNLNSLPRFRPKHSGPHRKYR